MDTVVTNTIGLVNLLELRLGLHYEDVPEQQKVAQDFAMSEFSLTLVLRKEDKQNSNMTWQKYKLNLRNSHLLEEFFHKGTSGISEDVPRLQCGCGSVSV